MSQFFVIFWARKGSQTPTPDIGKCLRLQDIVESDSLFRIMSRIIKVFINFQFLDYTIFSKYRYGIDKEYLYFCLEIKIFKIELRKKKK